MDTFTARNFGLPQMISAIECYGDGAKKFLQGQLTCDVNQLTYNTEQLTACCNLQGRVIFVADILMIDEQRFILKLPESVKIIALSHLEKYAKFSRCIVTDKLSQSYDLSPNVNDKAKKITSGIPNIYPETSEKFIPQRLNLHLIPGAISFRKGCYLGQEIIARLHFKGVLKHHMYLGEASSDVNINDDILDSSQKITGSVIDVCKQTDKTIFLFVNEIENSAAMVNNSVIIMLPLPYSF